jgi:uncharacterized protein RhaS with RHS repeats
MGSGRAQIATEWHADGGGKRNAYDLFGNLCTSTRYDSLGRVVEVINAEGRKTAYGYTYDNSIATVGGVNSGRVFTYRYREDGRMVISDGHHRAAAAIRAGIDKVPVDTFNPFK